MGQMVPERAAINVLGCPYQHQLWGFSLLKYSNTHILRFCLERLFELNPFFQGLLTVLTVHSSFFSFFLKPTPSVFVAAQTTQIQGVSLESKKFIFSDQMALATNAVIPLIIGWLCTSSTHIAHIYSCLHAFRPRLVDMGKVYRQTNLENLEQAFTVAEKELGVTRLLDPEGIVWTYCSLFWQDISCLLSIIYLLFTCQMRILCF